MVVLENDVVRVQIKEEGAEVTEFFHKENRLDFMWNGDPAYWGRVSPVLFPIVGRLKDDHYSIDGQDYTLTQHGFLRDCTFELVEKHETAARFQISSDGRFLDVYPYEFEVMIDYKLTDRKLEVRWKVLNKDTDTMYFSIGAHPAFKVPLQDGENISDYFIKIQPSKQEVTEYYLDQSLLHVKGTVNELSTFPLSAGMFANDALIYSNIDQMTIASKKNPHQIQVDFKGFPFVGIWSKYNEDDKSIAPFLCIEPWYGVADTYDTIGDFKTKLGINRLEQGDVFQASYSITITC
ncbi:aldose 1-epimerase family protein [Halalkalibacter nanhaiisediminis]|uniref:Galactose mutarotase-like enzyme n=1 Tax=Halalkalibacter nanhaiisediminis TaxID=688079 RepID=A0A562QSE8_9BACI|nr:aldose 1-epimerase family protein [Halalkalibacter nanhaiisediminis]TWI59682.1 galactose mutarotase-like enzyme [Halalkalibacter nanhaiisediminis]